jgi:hypothetical protein
MYAFGGCSVHEELTSQDTNAHTRFHMSGFTNFFFSIDNICIFKELNKL